MNRKLIMTETIMWMFLGSVLGGVLGGGLQHQRHPGWLWGGIAGAVGMLFFVVISRVLSARIGGPMGWALGGPIGLAIAGAVLLVAIGSPGLPMQLAMLGAMGGAISGCFCGP